MQWPIEVLKLVNKGLGSNQVKTEHGRMCFKSFVVLEKGRE